MSEKINGFGFMQVGGKNRPYQVNGTRQTKAFCELRNLELDQYWLELAKLSSGGSLASVDITIDFIYSALYAGARREKKTPDFDYDDVINWFEDADESEADEFSKPLQMLLSMLPKEEPSEGK